MGAPGIVLGLGNPGERYERTRHNLGFRVLDRLIERTSDGFRTDRGAGSLAQTAELPSGAGSLVLAKPQTYMNRSGNAALALCARYAVEPVRVLVVYDDADLVLGTLRFRTRGGAGGHNGLRSLIEAWNTEEFPRLRLGVRGTGRGHAELREYVLAPFEPDEEAVVGELIALAVDAIDHVLEDGLAAAMNRFNGRCATGEPRLPE